MDLGNGYHAESTQAMPAIGAAQKLRHYRPIFELPLSAKCLVESRQRRRYDKVSDRKCCRRRICSRTRRASHWTILTILEIRQKSSFVAAEDVNSYMTANTASSSPCTQSSSRDPIIYQRRVAETNLLLPTHNIGLCGLQTSISQPWMRH